MKVVRIRESGGPAVLELVERPDPTPAAGEALVAVRAAGVNRADLLQRRGRYPAPEGAPPDVPGLEFAGEVVEVRGAGAEAGGTVSAPAARAAGVGAREAAEASAEPPDVPPRRWVPGDRVMGLLPGGGYAERAVVPTSLLLPVPEGMSWEEAGAVPEVFLTAFDALFFRGRLAQGERALVHSAGGGVGTAALQLARAAGAERVFGTASAAKLRGLEELGLAPDVAVDYERESFAERVREETEGEGVHVILDTVGAPYWEDNLDSLATLGRLVLVGLLGGARAEVDLGAIMRGRVTVVGTVLRSRPVREKAEVTAAFRERFLPALVDGRLRPVVDRVVPLAEAAEAHRVMEENRNLGKIVLVPSA